MSWKTSVRTDSSPPVASATGVRLMDSAAAGSGPAPSTLHVREDTTTSGKPPRLLLVDDEPSVVASAALYLRRGFDVTTCTDPRAALKLIDNDPPFTVVVSDLRMPHLDGIQFLSEVKKRSPQTARLLLTGYADVTAAVAAVNEAAVHRFLTKPCRPQELRKTLEETLAELAEREHGFDAAIGRLGESTALCSLAASIGGEINQLLTSLDDGLDFVKDQSMAGEATPIEHVGVLDMVRIRLGQHATQLRNLAKPRHEELGPVDLGDIARACTSLLGSSGTARQVHIDLKLPGAPIYVCGQDGLLRGALIHLLKNAVEALQRRVESKTGGPRFQPRIEVIVETQEDRAACVIVKDNGGGIPDHVRSALFKRPVSTKDDAGAGLGLVFVKEVMQRHGGRIDIWSQPGDGTQVVLTLPWGFED